MIFTAVKTELKEIQTFRQLFLNENNFQIRYHACHERHWSDSYLLQINGINAGYGSVKGKETLDDRDDIFEFYVLPGCRSKARHLFESLRMASESGFIECQSNDLLLSSMMFEFAENIHSEVMLFSDLRATDFTLPGVIFRPSKTDDLIFVHQMEPVGDYVLEVAGKIVATGGFMQHYNPPFVDLFMEVSEKERQKGLGTYLLQEIKKECYQRGKIPSARCQIHNYASRATLFKSGFTLAGFMLLGEVKK